ncbi:hypothetical protein [Kitasatospora sp. NPDC001527]|uniref:hypothetical protein n=1 Tax=Kitasatospora sp. NPDC001527 TaxID=3154519 RepID=UPI00333026D9
MKKTEFPARTPLQQVAMEEAVGNRLGELPAGLGGRTLDSLLEKGYVYVGDNRGRLYRTAVARGYTGFPHYFLTRRAYRALGVELTYVVCGECGTGRYAATADGTGYRCTNDECDHEMTDADFVVDEPGEYIELRHWRLVVLQREAADDHDEDPADDEADRSGDEHQDEEAGQPAAAVEDEPGVEAPRLSYVPCQDGAPRSKPAEAAARRLPFPRQRRS